MGSQAQRISAQLVKEVERVCKSLVLAIDRNLRKATPVDTGHARRNWVPSVGQRSSDVSDSDAAHAKGVADVLRYQLTQGLLWLSNNTPYIVALNYGHSKQAPAAFVEFAVDQALLEIKESLAKLGGDVSGLRAENAARATKILDEVTGAGASGASNVASAYNPLGGSDD